MKTPSALSSGVAPGLLLLVSGFSLAEPTPPLPDRTSERPKFTSKIHIPAKPAAEATPLAPAGYKLVFCDEFGDGQIGMETSSSVGFPHDEMSVIASTLKCDRWVDESKLPNEMLYDCIRVYQHPKYREAEAKVRAEVLRPLPPLKMKKSKPARKRLEDLN